MERRKRKKAKSKSTGESGKTTSAPMKVERNKLLAKRERLLKAAWSSSHDLDDEKTLEIPSNFKKYRI